MATSTCRRLTLSLGIVSVIALNCLVHASPAFSQLAGESPAPARISTASLYPGVGCRITLESTSSSDVRAPITYAGTVKEITPEEVVLVSISEGRIEQAIPILGRLPIIGRFFTKTSIGREETTHRIPIAKIAVIEVRGAADGNGAARGCERIGVEFR